MHCFYFYIVSEGFAFTGNMWLKVNEQKNKMQDEKSFNSDAEGQIQGTHICSLVQHPWKENLFYKERPSEQHNSHSARTKQPLKGSASALNPAPR